MKNNSKLIKNIFTAVAVMFSLSALAAPSNESLQNLTGVILDKIKQKESNRKLAIASFDIETYGACMTIGTFITVQQVKFNSSFDETMILGVATINAANAYYRQAEIAKGMQTVYLDKALKANTPYMLQDSNGFFMQFAVSCATKGMNLLEKLNFK